MYNYIIHDIKAQREGETEEEEEEKKETTPGIHVQRDNIGYRKDKEWKWQCEKVKIIQWKARKGHTWEEIAEHGIEQEQAAQQSQGQGFSMVAWDKLA